MVTSQGLWGTMLRGVPSALNLPIREIAGAFEDRPVRDAGVAVVGHARPNGAEGVAACVTSALLLMSYVTYHAQAGSKPFEGAGILRTIYFSILIPHVILAAAVLPLAIVTLTRGLKRDDDRHRRIARWTLPIWLFVSVSGVAVYLMLYQLPQ